MDIVEANNLKDVQRLGDGAINIQQVGARIAGYIKNAKANQSQIKTVSKQDAKNCHD
jgi:hypothetical protein